jgi:hypothetical protein
MPSLKRRLAHVYPFLAVRRRYHARHLLCATPFPAPSCAEEKGPRVVPFISVLAYPMECIEEGAGHIHSSRSARRRNSSGTECSLRDADA